MSRARRLRNTVQWARYVNRYAHVPGVVIAGQAGYRAIWAGLSGTTWRHVRRQAKHRFGKTVNPGRAS